MLLRKHENPELFFVLSTVFSATRKRKVTLTKTTCNTSSTLNTVSYSLKHGHKPGNYAVDKVGPDALQFYPRPAGATINPPQFTGAGWKTVEPIRMDASITPIQTRIYELTGHFPPSSALRPLLKAGRGNDVTLLYKGESAGLICGRITMSLLQGVSNEPTVSKLLTGIPLSLSEAIKRKAVERGMSANAVILEVISAAIAM